MSAIQLNAKASPGFAAKLAQTQQLLQQGAQEFAREPGATAPALTLACSLGAEDMVLAHLVNALAIDADIFVLETGMLHAQTLALLAQLQATSTAPVNVYRPDAKAAAAFVAREGKEAMYQSIELRKACCQIRKMEPLERALAGKKAWITGLRREQSGARAEVPGLDRSDAKRAKLNPLADWTWGDVWHYIASNDVAYNPLHDEFFPSIGCAPCTRAIAMGEDFRAGRWWWENSKLKECGLHVGKTQQSDSSALAVPAKANLLAEQVKDSSESGQSQNASAQAHVAAGDVKPEGRAEAKTLNKETA
jgi:phosphoadenosine phosphosulfate reductase